MELISTMSSIKVSGESAKKLRERLKSSGEDIDLENIELRIDLKNESRPTEKNLEEIIINQKDEKKGQSTQKKIVQKGEIKNEFKGQTVEERSITAEPKRNSKDASVQAINQKTETTEKNIQEKNIAMKVENKRKDDNKIQRTQTNLQKDIVKKGENKNELKEENVEVNSFTAEPSKRKSFRKDSRDASVQANIDARVRTESDISTSSIERVASVEDDEPGNDPSQRKTNEQVRIDLKNFFIWIIFLEYQH